MMLNRREFITSSLSAGLALGAGSLLISCSGVRRGELPDLYEAENSVVQLDDSARTILYHASLAPSGHNSQPWRVRVEGPGLWTVEVDESRQLPAVDPDSRELLLSIGAFAGWFIITSPGQTAADLIETGRRFERMALLARERGIGIHPMTQILEEKHGIEQLASYSINQKKANQVQKRRIRRICSHKS